MGVRLDKLSQVQRSLDQESNVGSPSQSIWMGEQRGGGTVIREHFSVSKIMPLISGKSLFF